MKVFRTPVGFHDAYVAALSQKAAILAWGSDRDVFARGEAEQVTDAGLIAEPLSKPGVVIKKLRGTAAEQLAALPPNKPAKAKGRDKEPPPSAPKQSAKPSAKPPSKPSRAKLEKAEQAVVALKQKHRGQIDRLRRKEAALARERKELEQAHSAELGGLTMKRNREAEAYEAAIDKWRAS